MLSFLDRFLYNFIQMLRLAIFVDKFLFQHYRDKVMVAVVGFRKIFVIVLAHLSCRPIFINFTQMFSKNNIFQWSAILISRTQLFSMMDG